MILDTIELSNFKSFAGTHTIELPRDPGLYFLTGQNVAEPALGANGAGKSTLWDAVAFALYGKTMRGVKASNVRTWGNTGPCWVKLSGTFGGAAHTIYRSWGPNKLTVDDDPTDEDRLQDLVGLDFQAFSHSIVIGQFSEAFFDLKPTEKMDIFSKVLRLESWLEYAGKASESANAAATKVQVLDERLVNKNHQLTNLTDRIDEIKVQHQEYDDDRDAKVEKLTEDIEYFYNELNKAQDIITDTNAAIEPIKNKIDDIKNKLQNSESIISAQRSSIVDHKADLQYLKKQANALEAKTQDFLHVSTAHECSLCYQDVPEEHAANMLAALEAELTEVNTEIKVVGLKLVKAKDDYDATVEQLDQERSKISTLDSKRRDLQDLIKSTTYEVTRTKQTLDAAEQNKAALIDAPNPFLKQLRSEQDRLQDTKSSIKKTVKQRVDAESEQSISKFWSKGFKDIRLSLVERALADLEIQINNSLTELGMAGWTVTLDVQKELKSGGIAKGFTVYVQSPHNTEPVPFESWSGGEGQRLRLAGTMAIANFILNYLEVDSDLEIYDEPSAHLSGSGLDDLLVLLQQRAQQLDKRIWLVDHNSIQFGGFSNTYTVTKDENGSCVELNN
jgi:DNA repair exonuclease SbcCD ATPase subunit